MTFLSKAATNKQKAWIALIGLLLACPCAQAEVRGASGLVGVRPVWAKAASEMNPNGSFLDDLEPIEATRAEVDAQIFDPTETRRMKQEYEDLVRTHEMREAFQVNTHEEDRAHVDRMSKFSKSLANQIGRFQIGRKLSELETAMESSAVLRVLKDPAAIIAIGAAIYNGKMLKFKLNDDTGMSARANVPSKEGQIAMNSPLINTQLDFKGSAPDPSEFRADPTIREEKVRLGLSRGLPIWGLSSGISYGGTTQTMSASLEKRFSNELSAVVDTSRSLSRSDQGAEETLKLLYGLQF